MKHLVIQLPQHQHTTHTSTPPPPTSTPTYTHTHIPTHTPHTPPPTPTHTLSYQEADGFKDAFLEEVLIVLEPQDGRVCVFVSSLEHVQALVANILHATQFTLSHCVREVCVCGGGGGRGEEGGGGRRREEGKGGRRGEELRKREEGRRREGGGCKESRQMYSMCVCVTRKQTNKKRGGCQLGTRYG